MVSVWCFYESDPHNGKVQLAQLKASGFIIFLHLILKMYFSYTLFLHSILYWHLCNSSMVIFLQSNCKLSKKHSVLELTIVNKVALIFFLFLTSFAPNIQFSVTTLNHLPWKSFAVWWCICFYLLEPLRELPEL